MIEFRLRTGAHSNAAVSLSIGRNRQAGGAIVEYAFAALIFLTLVFGVGGFSHALYAYHFVSNIAKEAARWAAVNGSTCGADSSCNGTAPMFNTGPADSTAVNTFVTNHVPLGINSSLIATSSCGLSDTGTCADSAPDKCKTGNTFFVAVDYPGCTVKVTVAYAYTYIFPLLPKKTTTTAPCTKPGFCISSTAEMVIAH
jgi:Flp pilus assembly protein TadG